MGMRRWATWTGHLVCLCIAHGTVRILLPSTRCAGTLADGNLLKEGTQSPSLGEKGGKQKKKRQRIDSSRCGHTVQIIVKEASKSK